jgi:23S rRNA pseudouridine1911/1915/1917 synthase
VGAGEEGQRVDVVLAARTGVTRTLAQRALRDGTVTVGSESVRASFRLETGQRVEGTIPEPTFEAPDAESIPIEVRYSDERVLVVSKPPGLVTHPARGHEGGTLVNALLALGGTLSGAGSVRPGIVHRLDKDTSGLLLVARDDAAHAFLVDALRDRRIERRYLALVRGRPPAGTGTIEAPIGRHPRKRTLQAVVGDGRPSVTHYRVLEPGERFSLLELSLETGRTHQIRVHLSHLGHPVAGDKTYGGYSEATKDLGLTRPFLHAYRLAFPHPDDQRRIEVDDPLPPDLAESLAAAGLGREIH